MDTLNSPNTLNPVTPAGSGAQLYDAGFVQRREWMLYKIREDHYPINLPMFFDLEAFDHRVFQRVIALVVEKHEVLRTTLQAIGGSLQQVVHPPDDYPVGYTFIDISGRDAAGQQAFIKEKTSDLYKLPFNLEYGPLFRITVFALGPSAFKVHLVFHHTVCDQFSTGIFRSDAIRFWGMVVQGQVEPMHPGRAQYRTYTRFENQLLDTSLSVSYQSYWQAWLGQFDPRLGIMQPDRWNEYYDNLVRKVELVRKKLSRLPVCDPRFTASVVRRFQTHQAGIIHYQYASETHQNISHFKKRSNSSLYTLFVASLLVALHKLSGQEIFAFDIPAARRVDKEYSQVMGWLASGGICIFDVREYRSTSQFLTYLDRQLHLLSKHCVYPFETMDYHSRVPAGSTMPVFFTLTDSSTVVPVQHPAGGITLHQPGGGTSYQNLDLFVHIGANVSKTIVTYNSFLIAPRTIEELMPEQEASMNRIMQDVLAANGVRT